MTEYDWREFGTAGETELVVEYNYSVEAVRYFSNRKRFAWRQFRSGSQEAIAIAKSWAKGKEVRVFYDPTDPSNAALDNLFTPGDWKTLAFALAGLLLAPVIGVLLAVDAWDRVRIGMLVDRQRLTAEPLVLTET